MCKNKLIIWNYNINGTKYVYVYPLQAKNTQKVRIENIYNVFEIKLNKVAILYTRLHLHSNLIAKKCFDFTK